MDMEQLHAMLQSAWTVWLMLITAAIMVYAMLPGKRRDFEEAASIPFKDDQGER